MLALVKLLGGVRATIFAAIATGALVFGGIQSFRLDRTEQQLQTLQLKSEAASKRYTEQLLEQERLTAQRIAALESKHLQTQEKADDEYEKVLGDLRVAKLRLRDRFVCSQPNPTASGGASGSDGEAPTGLLEQDVQFLVSEAKRSDDVVRQLTLAQELLTIYKRHYDELRARQK